MGHVTVEAKIINPLDETRYRVVPALVDTGATRTVIPAELAEDLRLPVRGRSRVRTATGAVELPLSWAILEIAGKSDVTSILVSGTVDRALIGVVTLEAMGLMVDPTTGQLKETELLLYEIAPEWRLP